MAVESGGLEKRLRRLRSRRPGQPAGGPDRLPDLYMCPRPSAAACGAGEAFVPPAGPGKQAAEPGFMAPDRPATLT